MRRRFTGILLAGACALALPLAVVSPAVGASPQLATAVSQKPVKWTPNVSADAKVGQEGSGAACDAAFFGADTACQSEVYSTAFVNGDVIVAGAFTKTCPPGPLSNGLCAKKSQVTRDDIFAYKASTGAIDPNFKPVLDAGPVYSVIAGPKGTSTVYVGGGFTTVDGAKHKGLVQLHVEPGVTKGPDADGAVVTGFTGKVGDIVHSLALSPDGKSLYVAGQFGSVNGVRTFANGGAINGLARLNSVNGALDPTFAFSLSDPPSGSPIKGDAIALSPSGAELAVVGPALEVNGQSRPRLAIINTGTKLGAPSSLADFTAPILANNCHNQHDYVRSVSFSQSGAFVVISATGYYGDGSTPFAVCDAVARFNVNAGDTTTTGTPVDVAPAWIDYGGGDSFYSVAVAGNVVYAGGHDRWANNQCGQDQACEPNVVLTNGLTAMDANTGMALPWWHPQTLRGDGTMYLNTFGAGSYDGKTPGLVMGTDIDMIGGTYHAENAVFPMAATTSATAGGPIPSGMFNEDGGTNTGTPMCVDAGNEQAGTAVTLANCDNQPEQNWSEGTGHTLQVNGKCLGTNGNGTAPGTGVVLAACKSGTTTQEWTQGAGNSLVNTGASGTGGQVCLDDPGSSTTAGTQLDIAACSGGSNQVWPLPAAQGPPSGAPVGPVWLQQEQKDTQMPCLDDSGGKTTTGNKVQMWTCEGDGQEQWTLESGGTIRLDSKYCLDSAGGAGASGTAVVLDPCNGKTSQVWTPEPGENNALVQKSSGLCLTDPSTATSDGIGLQIQACNQAVDQDWHLSAN
jgi:Ricin-type beta-trefoil lectin domain